MAMKFNIPTLDKWATYNDILVGEAVNHPQFEQRQRVATNKCIKLDIKMAMAVCVADEVWQLGRPGKLGDYVDPVTKKFF
jgi:hypothetical protein